MLEKFSTRGNQMEADKKTKTDVVPAKGVVDAGEGPAKGPTTTNPKGPVKGGEKSFSSRFFAAISVPKEAQKPKPTGSGTKPSQPVEIDDLSLSDPSGDEDTLPPPAQGPTKAPAARPGEGKPQAGSRITRSRSTASSRTPSVDEAGGSTNPPPTKGDNKAREAARNEALRRYLALDELDELMESDSSDSFSEDEGRTAPIKPPPKPSAASAPDAKRGRGRPPTTGEYVGLADAKRALVEAQRAELELQSEKDIVERAHSMVSARVTRSRTGGTLASQAPPESRTEHAEGLQRQIADSLAVVAGVAKVSKGLKGTLQKALKEAVVSVQEASEELLSRTDTEEVALLRAANRRMEAELADLRSELASIRSELAEARAGSVRSAPPPPPEPIPPPTQTTAANLDRLILLMENRFAALEERIPPARPALSPCPASSPRPAPPRTTPPSPSLISGRLAEEFPPLPSRRVSTETAIPRSPPSARPAPHPPAADATEGWTTVGRKKRTRKRAAQPPSGTQPAATTADAPNTRARRRGGRVRGEKEKGEMAQAPTSQPPPPPPPPPSQKKSAARGRKAPRMRAPKSSAVVLTLQSGAEERGVTYLDLLSRAKANIRLADLGIEGGLQLKRARTGARMLVVPGAASAPQADALAASLRTVLNAEDVRVSRPEKTVGLRVSGLDDTTTEEDVAAAIARTTGCSPESVKATKVRPGPDGAGTTVVVCPVAAAKSLMKEGTKLLVGWASATVKALPHRAQRCYRCHELGHVAARCTSEADRSDFCYRCGKSGHLVTGPCTAKPHCSVCEAAGRPAGHQLGGGSCGSRKPTRRNKASRTKAPDSAAAAAATTSAAAGSGET